MNHHIYLKVAPPYGTTIRQSSDLSYYLYYEEKDTVLVRDWLAELANEMTDKAVDHLKNQEEQIKQERADRQAAIKHAANPTKAIKSEITRVNGKLDMMGPGSIAPSVAAADGVDALAIKDEPPVPVKVKALNP